MMLKISISYVSGLPTVFPVAKKHVKRVKSGMNDRPIRTVTFFNFLHDLVTLTHTTDGLFLLKLDLLLLKLERTGHRIHFKSDKLTGCGLHHVAREVPDMYSNSACVFHHSTTTIC
jgi:hypothetical protein